MKVTAKKNQFVIVYPDWKDFAICNSENEARDYLIRDRKAFEEQEFESGEYTQEEVKNLVDNNQLIAFVVDEDFEGSIEDLNLQFNTL